jgi:hypothetical protein
MRLRHVFVAGLATMAISAVAGAQVKTTSEKVPGQAKVTTSEVTGEVVAVEGDTLVAKIQPEGNYRVFHVKPGREFLIDGQSKQLADLKPGTVLTATTTTSVTPETVRTTSVLNATVWWVGPGTVVLTHENGENHEYKVPANVKFMVEGKEATLQDLRQGMKVSAKKVVEEPRNEISSQTVVTGRAPQQ